MKRLLPSIVMSVLCIVAFATPAHGVTMAERTAGKILLDVEHNGEAWYVYPGNLHRYYLGRPDDAFSIMRFLSLGITDANLAKIPTSTESFEGDLALRQRLAGWILLQVEQHGEAWYVYPNDLKRYYLDRPDDAFAIMTNLGLGITAADLVQIPISDDYLNLGSSGVDHQSFTLSIPRGNFDVEVVTAGRASHKMITDTATTSDCEDNCPAKTLQSYIAENGADTGIHGTYFCPPDYAPCADKDYTFNSPVYNTAAEVMIQEDKLRFHNGPMLAVGTNGTFYYFHRTKDFGSSVQEFEDREGTELQAAIANYPSLVENGAVVVESEPIEPNQELRGVRGGLGFNDDKAFLVIARSASVRDMGYIMEGLGADWALNLDGGGSAALYVNGGYTFGPGRLLPNAVVFAPK
jgi:hypothetical protein